MAWPPYMISHYNKKQSRPAYKGELLTFPTKEEKHDNE